MELAVNLNSVFSFSSSSLVSFALSLSCLRKSSVGQSVDIVQSCYRWYASVSDSFCSELGEGSLICDRHEGTIGVPESTAADRCSRGGIDGEGGRGSMAKERVKMKSKRAQF